MKRNTSLRSTNKTEDLTRTTKQLKEVDKQLVDFGYDSDDVFANNPSSLMLHKYKVVRKFKEIDIETTVKPELIKPTEPEICTK